jgi:NAD(P)-dependent dehydrogenase (short-subunit alcohol dehydrogenase family)
VTGRVAVVTGASGGLGRACALALADAGAELLLIARRPGPLHALAGEIAAAGGTARAFALDVAEEKRIVEVVDDAARAFGRLDVVVNNAGTAKRVPTVELETADWNRVLDVNLTAAMIGSREAAKHMIRQGSGGRIVNVASIMGLSGGGLYPNAGYHATKGALVNLTRALAAEWAKDGIRVNAIAPTFLKTKLTEKLREDPAMVAAIEARTPLGRFAVAEEVSPGILYLASRASAMVTGHTLAIDGGWLAV